MSPIARRRRWTLRGGRQRRRLSLPITYLRSLHDHVAEITIVCSEVHLIVLSFSAPRGDKSSLGCRATMQPAICDLDSGPSLSTRLLTTHEASDLTAYLKTVITDMESLSTAFVMTYGNELINDRCGDGTASAQHARHDVTDLYRSLLVALANKPRELLNNLLAALLVSRIEAAVDDPLFHAAYRSWEDSITMSGET
jgi:hypothetical protein